VDSAAFLHYCLGEECEYSFGTLRIGNQFCKFDEC
jgi:hypothetical protein